LFHDVIGILDATLQWDIQAAVKIVLYGQEEAPKEVVHTPLADTNGVTSDRNFNHKQQL
jgi:hypothetical protein